MKEVEDDDMKAPLLAPNEELISVCFNPETGIPEYYIGYDTKCSQHYDPLTHTEYLQVCDEQIKLWLAVRQYHHEYGLMDKKGGHMA